MSLPWVRLDSNIAIHDKMLALLSDPSAKRHQAAASYMFGLGWCGAAGTDGHVPRYALPTIHGSVACAGLLVRYRLWDEALTVPVDGWYIHNFEVYQQLADVTGARHAASIKANCIRWHGEDCGCWKSSAA